MLSKITINHRTGKSSLNHKTHVMTGEMTDYMLKKTRKAILAMPEIVFAISLPSLRCQCVSL